MQNNYFGPINTNKLLINYGEQASRNDYAMERPQSQSAKTHLARRVPNSQDLPENPVVRNPVTVRIKGASSAA